MSDNAVKKQLAEARARAEAAEAKLADQHDRLNALGRGREETMRALAEARAELARLRQERDLLQKRLAAVENMQTATMALADADEPPAEAVMHALPSVEDLMASLNALDSGPEQQTGAPPTPAEDDPEMISPELVFPEEYGHKLPPPRPPASTKVLVFVDADPPIKYPLSQPVMTIGRSETADIRVDGDYISRVHARIVLDGRTAIVEDIASKNGIKVNFKLVKRHPLRHGDILSLGKLHFTYIDTASSDEE